MAGSSCSELVESYVRWLTERIAVAEVEGACEITTPFVDRHNDHIQIYVERTPTGLRLTDDGYILSDLRACGVDVFSTARRQELLETLTRGFGVRVEDQELVVDAIPDDFPRKKHNLVQAMLAVNDLFVTARPTVVSLFKEDVEQFLRDREVRFTSSIKLPGRSGLDHHFDMVIPSSKAAPERLVDAVRRLDRPHASSLIFAWTDVRASRPQSAMCVFLSDEEPVREDLLAALRSYEIDPILWSEREKHIPQLVG
jgi:hypothetical protein